MPAKDANNALNWDRPFTAPTFSSLYATDADFPPMDNSRAFDAAAGEDGDGMPGMFHDDTSPCTTDSDTDDDATKVADETKGAQLQGGDVLTSTLCTADCNGTADLQGGAAPIISRQNPAMGLGSEHQTKLAFALLHNCDPTKVETNTLHQLCIKPYRMLFKMLTSDSQYDGQRWVEAVMVRRGPSPASGFVPFEDVATPWQIASQFNWAPLDLPKPQIEVSNHLETSDFPANW